MFREKCKVTQNEKIAPGHFLIQFTSPKIAASALPGQFVQISCSESFEPLLPRPFSFLTTDKKTFSFIYHVVGKGTKILSQVKKGDELWVLGPLGTGWTVGSKRKAVGERILVGGGVGIPPLYHLAQYLIAGDGGRRPSRRAESESERTTAGRTRESIHVFLGARDKSLLLCEKEFKKLGVQLHLATDNGSKGQKGFVTQILEKFIVGAQLIAPKKGRDESRPYIHTCGPTPMLKAVSALAQKYNVPCEVSVEVPMACGFGACLGCAVKVHHESGFRNAIACCEGPVFDGASIIW